MTQQFKPGDRVEWHSSGGTSQGEVEEVITKPTEFKNHHFEASEQEPEYRVKSTKTGKEAIHKPEALKKNNRKD
uniref:Hypervirulence associated protein TUDOR domain-containing protein n=1 Tax=Cyanothece sp. (strain PCC 7425 / ATCC 29141) TaxID=395961 RepID=B8HK09_CYAP4